MAGTQKGLDLSRRESRPQGKNYLLAIAIDEYVHCSRLNNAVADVSAFVSLMERRYHFEADCISFIQNAEATKKRIELELLKLIRVITPQDNLVIYFSGHGRYDAQFGGNWVPVDAGISEEDWPDYLSNDLIKGYLNRIPSFHTFLIADSCFSGSLFIDKSKEKFTGDRRETEASRWGLTSGKREVVSDGPPGHHSPFAAALLDVLEKADQPPSVMYLCHMVLEKVQANEMQTPMGSPLAVKGHQGGQFVFHFRADENADWAEMQESPEGCKQYLALYPDGKYRNQAESILTKAEEELAWETAVAAKSVAALLAFEENFPKSARVASKEADRLIADLEEEKLWSDATRSDTVSAFRDYLRRTRTGKYKGLANEKIATLRQKEEDIAWGIALSKANRADYENFLRQFPNSRYAAEARSFINQLEKATAQIPPTEEPRKQFVKSPQAETLKDRKKESNNQAQEKPSSKKVFPQDYFNFKWVFAALLFGTTLSMIIWSPWSGKTIRDKDASNKSLSSSPLLNKNITSDSLIFIQGGTFQMGSNDGDDDEEPVHSVTLSDFYMGIHEVTVEKFARFADATGYKTDAEKNNDNRNWRHDTQGNLRPAAEYNHPVIYVSWNDAAAYCNWLSEQHGYRPVYRIGETTVTADWTANGYRLPTEAEWEYAARSRGGSDKWAGTSSEAGLASFANFCDKNCTYSWKTENQNDGYEYTAPVGSLRPNATGLYDMSGNVYEWCWDWYAVSYSSSAQNNPKGPDSGSSRVIRGGSCGNEPAVVRCANRGRYSPGLVDNDLGFRLSRAVR